MLPFYCHMLNDKSKGSPRRYRYNCFQKKLPNVETIPRPHNSNAISLPLCSSVALTQSIPLKSEIIKAFPRVATPSLLGVPTIVHLEF